MNQDIRKLNEQIRFQSEFTQYLALLFARLLGEIGDKDRLAALLEAEKSTPVGKRLEPLIVRMQEAARGGGFFPSA